jgi:hypothetical protein
MVSKPIKKSLVKSIDGFEVSACLSLDITTTKPLSVVYDIKGILGQADGRL